MTLGTLYTFGVGSNKTNDTHLAYMVTPTSYGLLFSPLSVSVWKDLITTFSLEWSRPVQALMVRCLSWARALGGSVTRQR